MRPAGKPLPDSSLAASRLRELFEYRPETGEFVRLVTRSATARAGQKAGCLRPEGYMTIMIDRVPYQSHRLAWLYVTGDWPPADLDHINGNRSDNRIANLRPASRSQNNANAKLRSDNKSGSKGVSWDAGRNRWHAQIRAHGKQHHLGRFHSKEEAQAAYATAAKRMFGEYARPISNA